MQPDRSHVELNRSHEERFLCIHHIDYSNLQPCMAGKRLHDMIPCAKLFTAGITKGLLVGRKVCLFLRSWQCDQIDLRQTDTVTPTFGVASFFLLLYFSRVPSGSCFLYVYGFFLHSVFKWCLMYPNHVLLNCFAMLSTVHKCAIKM